MSLYTEDQKHIAVREYTKAEQSGKTKKQAHKVASKASGIPAGSIPAILAHNTRKKMAQESEPQSTITDNLFNLAVNFVAGKKHVSVEELQDHFDIDEHLARLLIEELCVQNFGTRSKNGVIPTHSHPTGIRNPEANSVLIPRDLDGGEDEEIDLDQQPSGPFGGGGGGQAVAMYSDDRPEYVYTHGAVYKRTNIVVLDIDA